LDADVYAELFADHAGENSKAVQFQVLSSAKFPGDLAVPAFIAEIRNPRVLMLLYRDRQLAVDIAGVHPRFRQRGNVTI
jgi:hypothetical protein